MDVDPEARARAAAGVSVLPLGLVAVSFFLPAVETCGQIRTPAQEVASGAWWGLPPFVLAVVLLVVTAGLLTRARHRPGHRRLWLGPYRQHPVVLEPRPAPGRLPAFILAAGLSAGVILTALLAVANKPNGADFVISCAAVYLGLLWSGVGRLHAWTRWAYVLLAWAVQATFPVGLIVAHGAIDARTPGATLYVLGVSIVLAATVWVLGPPFWRAIARRAFARR